MSRAARQKPDPGFLVGVVKYPQLPAYRYRIAPALRSPGDDGWRLRVWCCWCDCWHHHSCEYGHRAAHCHTASPYLSSGYVLTDPATLERKR